MWRALPRLFRHKAVSKTPAILKEQAPAVSGGYAVVAVQQGRRSQSLRMSPPEEHSPQFPTQQPKLPLLQPLLSSRIVVSVPQLEQQQRHLVRRQVIPPVPLAISLYSSLVQPQEK